MKKYSLLLFTFILFYGCKKDKTSSVPICIKEKTEIFKSQIVCSSGAAVSKYSFQGKFVYLFGVGNCIADAGTNVFDENCNLLGTLGTLAGTNKVNGVNFEQNSTFIENLWSN